MNIQERYRLLKEKVVEREKSFQDFISMLECDSDWMKSPASTRFHLNREGGLLEHSVGVTETLLRLRGLMAPEISEEVCVIVGLLHDVGKIGMPGRPRYIKNTNEWEIEKRGMTYKINPEEVYMNIAARSLYLISKYIPLTESEAQAVLYHDGQYVEANREAAHKEVPLTLLLHFADNWTANVYEDGMKIRKDEDYYGKDKV